MTFKEFYYYQTSESDSEKREWQRLSTMMALHANMNAGKGKSYSPDDFNPFAKTSTLTAAPDDTKSVHALADRLRKRRF